jgi:uncharacterized membrane protein
VPRESRRPSRAEPRLDQPRELRRALLTPPSVDPEAFGRLSERFARFLGTAQFLVYMTVFVAAWLAWNTLVPPDLQFDPREKNYTLLTLILSLQASYAAPLILLAQNRQTDRERVVGEQDRARDERGLADTEYLTREVAALRITMRDIATRDFVRSELRALLEELDERGALDAQPPEQPAAQPVDKPTDKPTDSPTDKSSEKAPAQPNARARDRATGPADGDAPRQAPPS